MTDEEIREAQKSFRVSIMFWKWAFIIYGNWKRRIVYLGGNHGFHILEFHPFISKKSIEEP